MDGDALSTLCQHQCTQCASVRQTLIETAIQKVPPFHNHPHNSILKHKYIIKYDFSIL